LYLSLPTDRTVKRKLEAAQDYLGKDAWGTALPILQSILDAPEDVFIPVPNAEKDPKAPAPRPGRSEERSPRESGPPSGPPQPQPQPQPPAGPPTGPGATATPGSTEAPRAVSCP